MDVELTVEILFMGMESETTAYEAYNSLKDIAGFEQEVAADRTYTILSELLSDQCIEVWLGDPYSFEPVLDERNSKDLITMERILTPIEDASAVLVYATTEKGVAIVEQNWENPK